MTVTTIYEWVVETLDEAGDIIDCFYWDRLTDAQAFARQCRAEGEPIDFGLCRRVVDDEEGDLDRGYIYRNAEGWPADRRFDNGRPVPKRFTLTTEGN